MSFVIAMPEALTAVASELGSIGSAIGAANAAAAIPTTNVLTAAADEVSTQVAALFGTHAATYQALAARAAEFHAQFMQTLRGAANSYALAEAANVSPLQTLEQDVLGAINGPAQALLGRPLIGNGADGAWCAHFLDRLPADVTALSASGMFAPSVVLDGPADAQSRLLARLGRDPSWRPET